MKQAPTNNVGCKYQGNKIRILKNISGVLKPARLVLKLSLCNHLDSQVDVYDVTMQRNPFLSKLLQDDTLARSTRMRKDCLITGISRQIREIPQGITFLLFSLL